jgi:3-oxoacyl-[acyl-carrier protein] reductase
MDLGIAGKRAVVAAGSKGLGFGAAAALAEEGCRVAICGRDATAVSDASARIGAIPFVADVSDPDNAAQFVRDAAEALDGVDILIANAGGPPPGTFATTDLDAYLHAFDLNCRSSIAMCQAAIPTMREQQWGRVVAITSVGVKQPIGTLIASSTARAALTAFLKITAREVAADGVTVNSVLPGFHSTDRITGLYDDAGLEQLAASVPARTIGDAADFGKVVAFLCGRPAKYITGESILVDGGAYAGLV